MDENSAPQLWRVLNPEMISLQLKEKKKEGAIEELIELMVDAGQIPDKAQVLKKVLERERMISTGIGEGVAIPHAKHAHITEPIIALGRSKEGIRFESLDGKKVHLLFVCLSPKDDPAGYVKILGKTARLLDNADLREKLRQAESPQEIIEHIKTEEQNLK